MNKRQFRLFSRVMSLSENSKTGLVTEGCLEKPRIAWFCSTASHLKSSFYSKQVLPLISGEVECFGDDEDLKSASFCGKPLFHFLRAFSRHRDKPFTHFVYHVEDHPRAQFAQSAQALIPGVVFLHDINLNRLEFNKVAHASTGALLNDKMDELFGKDSERLGDLAARGHSIEVYDKVYSQDHGDMNPQSVLIVLNERALQERRAKGDFAVLASPAVDVIDTFQVEQVRKEVLGKLGLPRDTFLIAMGGRYSIEDRFDVCLEAFADFTDPKTHLLWLVADEEARINAERSLQRVGLETRISLRSDFYTRGFIAADVVLALKFDALRGLSPSMLSSLASGSTVITSAFGPSGELPGAVALKIPIGQEEKPTLSKLLQTCRQNTQLRQSLGENARRFVEDVWSPSAACLDLDEILESYGARLQQSQHEHQRDISSIQKDRLDELEKLLSQVVLEESLAKRAARELWSRA